MLWIDPVVCLTKGIASLARTLVMILLYISSTPTGLKVPPGLFTAISLTALRGVVSSCFACFLANELIIVVSASTILLASDLNV